MKFSKHDFLHEFYRSDSIEDQERQLYFKKHTIQQSCHPYVFFILLDLEMHSNSSKKT